MMLALVYVRITKYMLSMEPWAAAKKQNFFSVAVPPVPVRVLIQRPLAPSVASLTSVANDKGDDEILLHICVFCTIHTHGSISAIKG